MLKLTDKVAIITGGNSGIGEAAAKLFAKQGAAVVLVARRADKLTAVADEIAAAGGKALAIPADVTDPATAVKVCEETVKQFGKIDILINNAGMYPAMLVTDVTEKHFDRVIAVNLKGTFFVTQAVVNQSMIPNNYGRIVNISSCDGKTPASGVAIYGAAKAGVISLTKSFALELADYDINSNCVAPGWVESEAVLSGDRWKTYLPQIPSRRLGKLSEIAESCVFLCNDKVSYINGEILDVNGAIIMD